VAAHCFQYRVKLTADSQLKRTPSLLNISIRIIVPGNPDLTLKSLADRRGANNALTGLNIVIQNVNMAAPAQPTLAADFDGGGSFFVDLCIFGPGQAVSVPPLPWSDSTKNKCTKAYADINKSSLGPNSTYTITQWRDNTTENAINLLTYFKTPGTYNVVVVVDSYNYVTEGDPSAVGEKNNVSKVFTFKVDKTLNQIMVPMARRA
jgi:hypothetical protein